MTEHFHLKSTPENSKKNCQAEIASSVSLLTQTGVQNLIHLKQLQWHCASVWARSCHASAVDVELNQACHTITGSLKPTPLPALYCLASNTPPSIRCDTITKQERDKQMTDTRHPLYGHQEIQQRIVSRKSFTTVTGLQGRTPAQYWLERWMESDRTSSYKSLPPPSETLMERPTKEKNESL